MRDAKEIAKRWGFKRLTLEELERIKTDVAKLSEKNVKFFDVSEIAIMIVLLNVTSPILAFSICLIFSLFI